MATRTLLRLVGGAVGVLILLAGVRARTAEPSRDSQSAPTNVVATASDPTAAVSLPDPGATHELVDGFKAYAAGESERAVAALAAAAGDSVALEDWRLFVLAEAAYDVEDFDRAQAALRRLLDQHPTSPIHQLAAVRAAQMAAETRQWETALEWASRARELPLTAPKRSEIEALVWEIGAETDQPDLQVQAGRTLLIEDPLLADRLAVYPALQQRLGFLDLAELLTPRELERLARQLIDNRLAKEALSTLEFVPPPERAFEWTLLKAEALTRDYHGREALALLEGLDASDLDLRLALKLQRALAARDASKVRRSRTNLSSGQREELARQARQLLQEIADQAPSAELRSRALTILFAEVSDLDDSFEQTLPVLQQLRQLDPNDATGTRYLFRLGWQAYSKRDFPVAIGYWSELESLYPGTTTARGARYWTGRSHEALGHVARAESIYREILAGGTDDFYSRHARARLAEPGFQLLVPPQSPTEPWPGDQRLVRARWLSDLGLSHLALEELAVYADTAERRALCAEKAVFLARTGQRRDSIAALVCAFPSLGTPSQGSVPREALELYYPMDFRTIIEQRAEEQNLSAYLVFAMVRQESAFDATARSWAGARGLMQLMPATGKEIAQRFGLTYSISRLEDPDFSVLLGTRYFRQVLDMFDGNEVLALAGYNGGPYRIRKLWRQQGSSPELDRFVEDLALEETKTYVKRILLFEDSYAKLYPAGG